jgi:hypothetical protein
MKSIYVHFVMLLVSLTFVLAGTNRACAQAILNSSAKVVEKSAEQEKDLITALISMGHCTHAYLVEVEDVSGHSNVKGRCLLILKPGEKISSFTKMFKHVGLVAGVAQAYTGAKDIHEGKTDAGYVELAGAAANTTSAGAAMAGGLVLCHFTGGVGAGIDGAMDIYSGVHGKDAEKTAVGSVKCTVCILMTTSAVQPELAPVLIPIATVTYMSAIGIDVLYENRAVICNKTSLISDQSNRGIQSMVKNVKKSASTISEWSKSALADVEDSVNSNLEAIE